ncbi:MAG: hypothetical protein FJ255_10450 [Phycisphaerae bacterium]|nr:hypothetical protein [Phycisphaerae bacterium]
MMLNLRLRRPRLRLVGVIALALSAGALVPADALAQGRGGGGPGGFGGMMGGMGGGFGDVLNPSVNSRDLDRYGDILGLSADQKGAVRELFGGYQDQFRAWAEKTRDEMAAIRGRMEAERGQRGEGRGAGEAFNAIRESFTRLRGEREKMEQVFFEDVKTILTPEQEALWPKVERTRRRETTMARGFVAGENVDLFRVLERLNLPADLRATLTATLDQYEVDLDRALVDRNKVQEEGISNFMGGRFGRPDEGFDMEKAQKAFQEARDVSIRLRDVNRRYARQLEAQLPEDRRAGFNKAFNEASFPEAYRESAIVRNVTAAMGFADLTPDQRQRLTELRDQYTRESGPMAERLAKAIEEQQATMTIEQMMSRFRGGDDASPVAQARQARREQERAYGDKVRSVLTPEQIERLPQGDGRGEDRGGGERRERVEELRRRG